MSFVTPVLVLFAGVNDNVGRLVEVFINKKCFSIILKLEQINII